MNQPVHFRVLLVEDMLQWAEIFIEHQLKPVAKKMGYSLDIQQATTIRQAKEMLLANVFETMFLDLKLPDSQDAAATLAQIKPMKAIAPNMDIIVITGSAEGHMDTRSIEAGADSYLHKFDLADKPHLALQTLVKCYQRRNVKT